MRASKFSAKPDCSHSRRKRALISSASPGRLDRDDVGAQRDQDGGQVAGSGAEVEHARAGLERRAHRVR
ncbi:hypothetical protein ABT120_50255 [Nonomuraea angiospora]|uniref:hypothetical protein n=1 Tax=Nonomuraea angiospora TaxID=46172 RepID=UPI00331D3A2E